jgi:hypothetical protein
LFRGARLRSALRRLQALSLALFLKRFAVIRLYGSCLLDITFNGCIVPSLNYTRRCCNRINPTEKWIHELSCRNWGSYTRAEGGLRCMQ